MFEELIRPLVREGMITENYINKLDYYISKGPMTRYANEAYKMRKLIGNKFFYTKDIESYLMELGYKAVQDEKNNIMKDERR